MKKKILMLCMGCFLASFTAQAQWVVSDPKISHRASSMPPRTLFSTSSTANNMLNNFQETVKNRQAGQGVL